MGIVASALSVEHAQRDGRFWAHERHTDHLGGNHPVSYLAPQGFNANAAMSVRVTQIEAALREREIARNVADVLENGSLASPKTQHSTNGQNLAALREAYRTATRVEAIMIGDFLNTLTDAQLRAIFNMTQVEVTSLRANKLMPAADAAAKIRASSGA